MCSPQKPLQSEVVDAAWPAPTALYIHVPFCPYKCGYCDFVTHVGGESLMQPYVDAVCLEIERNRNNAHAGGLGSIYLGGGTPGMLHPQQIDRLLTGAGQRYSLQPTCEISLETNPDTVEAKTLEGVREAGVNRLSIGVQSLNGEELKALGRGHEPASTATAMESARKAGFGNVSLDLIYGVPRQTLESWRETLDVALSLSPDHLSLYSLIVEPKTRFDLLRRRGNLPLPEDDLVADMYVMACEMLHSAGFDHYEVANWARRGFECKHNLEYWRDHEFLAAGVGAFDYIRPYRSVRVKGTKRYVDLVNGHGSVITQRDEITSAIERFETAVMGLRLLDEGLGRERFQSRFPDGLDAEYGSVISELASIGFLTDDGDTIRMPEAMVPLANEAWERFLPA